MKNLFIACLIAISWFNAVGQDCGAQQFYEKGPPACNDFLEGVKCINLDITDSYDFEGKELAFLWHMGDGNTQEGLEVKHCYEKGGYYEASLSVIDPLTRIEMKDELLVDVYVKGDARISMTEVPDIKVGVPFIPEYELELPDDYVPINFYWSYGDGRFSCDSLPEVSYQGSNAFQLLLNIQVVNKTDTLYLCDDVTVNVRPTDPSGGTIDDYLNGLPVEARYLSAPVNFLLLQNNGDTYSIQDDYENLDAEKTYLLVAYRGNLMLVSGEIELQGEPDQMSKQLVEEAKNLAATKPIKLESIIFDLNELDLSKKHKKEIKATAIVLKEYPFLKVAIGSYTHTGGSFDRNKRLSLERSNLLKNLLVENGVAANRLVVADPTQQRALINTCLTGSNCDYEDKLLNRRADFKIIGISL